LPPIAREPVISRVYKEQSQTHETRKKLFYDLEKIFERPVVSFFSSFRHAAVIEDDDADMLEGVLQTIDLSKGLALIINSPGGYGLAAERIINICRSYSGTGEYWAIVPGKAKSAATMICFGASKVLMSPTSELGPIDPQVAMIVDNDLKRFSVCNIVDSYDDLFARAVKEEGNLQPYLQQLAKYDEREIKEFRASIDLSEDIAIRALISGMLQGKTKAQIKKKIEVFLTPKKTKTHGRPISMAEAEGCGLTIDAKEVDNSDWKKVYELYIRTNNYVSSAHTKCIESKTHSFGVIVRSGE